MITFTCRELPVYICADRPCLALPCLACALFHFNLGLGLGLLVIPNSAIDTSLPKTITRMFEFDSIQPAQAAVHPIPFSSRYCMSLSDVVRQTVGLRGFDMNNLGGVCL